MACAPCIKKAQQRRDEMYKDLYGDKAIPVSEKDIPNLEQDPMKVESQNQTYVEFRKKLLNSQAIK